MRRRSCGPAPPRPTRTRITNEKGLRRMLDKAPNRSYGGKSDMEFTPGGPMTTTTTTTTTTDLNFLGATARVLASGEGYGLVHMDMPAGEMPPLHVHRDVDEGFYCLGG